MFISSFVPCVLGIYPKRDWYPRSDVSGLKALVGGEGMRVAISTMDVRGKVGERGLVTEEIE